MSVLTLSCTMEASERHFSKGQFLWDCAHERKGVEPIKPELMFQNINDYCGPGRSTGHGRALTGYTLNPWTRLVYRVQGHPKSSTPRAGRKSVSWSFNWVPGSVATGPPGHLNPRWEQVCFSKQSICQGGTIQGNGGRKVFVDKIKQNHEREGIFLFFWTN